MEVCARQKILARLKKAPSVKTRRPGRPVLPAESWEPAELIAEFVTRLSLLGVDVHRVAGYEEAAARLSGVAKEEGFRHVMASADDVVKKLSLARWGRENQIAVSFAADFPTREEYKEAVFAVDAGITGVDYAIAESGTLCLVHRAKQPRLVSLAPITHVAAVPVEAICGHHEAVLERIYQNDDFPAHVTFITGPSITADIQSVPFRGMHGPRKLIVILIDDSVKLPLSPPLVGGDKGEGDKQQ